MTDTGIKRTRRTPAERAQTELETSRNVVKRLEDKSHKLADAYNDVLKELEEARQRVAYAEQNPALPFDADGYSEEEVEYAEEVEQAL